MYTVHHGDLTQLFEALRPASVLWIDPFAGELPWPSKLTPEPTVHRIDREPWEQLQVLDRFALGIVANTLEYLDKRTAQLVLGRLRDVNTQRFVALVPLGVQGDHHKSQWERADLLSFGLNLMASYRVDDREVGLYHYAVKTYKTTPEWFNSRHWANPERWRP
ncbi:MAG: DUF6231 family protein [Candidatus Competibacterales bacterium]